MNTTQMNRATKIALEFMLNQMDGLSLIGDSTGEFFCDLWDIKAVKGYYEQMAEDFAENYDEEWYSLWYVDKRSPCINWQVVSDAVQDNRDDLYLECLFL